MPIILNTQQSVRPVRTLPFCYLCTHPILSGEASNDDHVPPTGIFLVEDRDFPLILPTHEGCNNARSFDDQAISQLIGLLHGTPPSAPHNRLEFTTRQFTDGRRALAVGGFDLRKVIRRWVRAFHGALYREALSDGCLFMTNPPLAEAESTPDGPEFQPVPELISEVARELRAHRERGRIDQIVCRNGKMRYECVWLQADGGQWLCFYALDLYGWTRLGDIETFGRRGCVGAYHRPDYGLADSATTGERSNLPPVPPEQQLNPFD